MVPRRGADLRARPAPAAVAAVGLTLLDAAHAAAARLANPDDTEALHDFRVALRRLRTLLRSFREEVGDVVTKKLQRRVRDVARSTNPARDAEVQLAWIQAHKAELGASPRPGMPWLMTRLEGRRDRAYAGIREDGPSEFRQLDRRIRRALTRALADATPGRPTFAVATGRLVRAHAAELEQELEAARSTRDEAAIHRARIAVKRLRYLLEPLQDDASRDGTIIERLKQLQDLLGELHDLHVLAAELGDATADAAAERARQLHDAALRGTKTATRRKPVRPTPASASLLALARLAAQWEERLFTRVVSEWLDGGLSALLHDVLELGEALAVPPALPPPRLRAAPPRRAATRPARAE